MAGYFRIIVQRVIITKLSSKKNETRGINSLLLVNKSNISSK